MNNAESNAALNAIEKKRQEEIPNAKWATWALVQLARKMIQENNIVGIIPWIVDRLEQYDTNGPKSGPCSFVIATNCGHWGKGATLLEAAKTALKAGASRTSKAVVTLVINDSTPEINNSGYLITESVATSKTIGNVGTIGSILNANDIK